MFKKCGLRFLHGEQNKFHYSHNIKGSNYVKKCSKLSSDQKECSFLFIVCKLSNYLPGTNSVSFIALPSVDSLLNLLVVLICHSPCRYRYHPTTVIVVILTLYAVTSP